MKVLIVDDNSRVRALIKSFIREFADEIVECADGCEVLAAYGANHPDWVLMDVEMPVMDGFTASRNLLSMFPSARIVMVTRYDDDDLRKEAELAGACAYVVKDDLLTLQAILSEVSPAI
jgi:CheY-like chemotaxis protein